MDLHFHLPDSELALNIAFKDVEFPLYSLWTENSKEQLFSQLFDQILPWTTSDQPLNLRSYFPRKQYLWYSKCPDDSPSLVPSFPLPLKVIPNVYAESDNLVAFYSDELRAKTRREDVPISPYEAWNDPIWKSLIMKELWKQGNKIIGYEQIIQALDATVGKASFFGITKAINILLAASDLPLSRREELAGKKWLDISAGWGDRLLAACALKMEYDGYDPNSEMAPFYRQMISDWGNGSQEVITAPFETALLKDKKYDFIFTSPPFYEVELYSDEDTQSVVNYPRLDQWIRKFLFRALAHAWNSLSKDGMLILHLGDSKSVRIAEATNCFIQSYFPNAVFVNCLHIASASGDCYRPTWLWKKGEECPFYRFPNLKTVYPQWDLHPFPSLEISKKVNPSLRISNMFFQRKSFTFWDESKLEGGIKARALPLYWKSLQNQEIVYCGFDNQLLMIRGQKLFGNFYHTSLTIFSTRHLDCKAPCIKVVETRSSYSQTLKRAIAYCQKDPSRTLLTTLNTTDFIENLEDQLRPHIGVLGNPKRIWLSYTEGIKLRALKKLFPYSHFCCVKINAHSYEILPHDSMVTYYPSKIDPQLDFLRFPGDKRVISQFYHQGQEGDLILHSS